MSCVPVKPVPAVMLTLEMSPVPAAEAINDEPFHASTCPIATPAVLTSVNALIDAADILASALAFVKYKLVEPSDNASVSASDDSSAITQVVPLYFKILPAAAPDVSTSDSALILAAPIRASALASV